MPTLLQDLQVAFQKFAKANTFSQFQPENLYAPIDYILSLGGKSMRPTLLLLAYRAMGGEDLSKALPSAYAVELFHNFSLMHDDIMDNSPIRRGKETVHLKWNTNTAILSGDALLVESYKYLAQSPSMYIAQLLDIFNRTAIGICQGQQMDMNFETTWQVQLSDYIEMIRLKTAVLLQGALEMGAILANADAEKAYQLGKFGEYMGIAFQLQDDYLDTYGQTAKVGKRIGGDILQGKKTYLVLKALALSTPSEAENLKALLDKTCNNEAEEIAKIQAISQIFSKTGADKALNEAIKTYHQMAIDTLNSLALPNPEALHEFLETIMQRES